MGVKILILANRFLTRVSPRQVVKKIDFVSLGTSGFYTENQFFRFKNYEQKRAGLRRRHHT